MDSEMTHIIQDLYFDLKRYKRRSSPSLKTHKFACYCALVHIIYGDETLDDVQFSRCDFCLEQPCRFTYTNRIFK